MTAPARSEFPLSRRAIVAFTGPFGSGKTEVAINYSLAALDQGRATFIVDLDIVTPYFRVGDYRPQLTEMGLQVIAPAGALASFEVPALPPEIAGALRQEDRHKKGGGAPSAAHVVLDVGGDPVGARLLGVYASEIAARGYDMWLVVNPFRPSAYSPEAVADQARAIEATSGLRLTGLVADPHLGPATQPDHVEAGLDKVRRGAERLRLPVVFLAAEKHLLAHLAPSTLPVLPLQLLLQPPWDRN